MYINGKDMKEFIDNAQLGLISKDDVLEMLDAITGVLDEINSDIASVEDFMQQVDICGEGDTTNKDKLKELAPTYKIKPEDIDGLEVKRHIRAEVVGIMTELEKIRDTFKNFNKQNCFANIRALLKENPDIKIGMIEKEAGIRLGYMARLEKADNTSEPSMEFIASAAKLLGVTVDMLISGKIDGLNGNERFVLKFLDTLITDTLSGDMTWEKESPKELESIPYIDGNPQHILMKHAEYYDIGESGYPEIKTERAEFNSLFFNDNMRIDMQGNVYHVELPLTDTTVYIAHIKHENGTSFADDQYEVIIYQDFNLTGLCGSCQSAEEIKEQIIKLYKTIEEMNSGLGLNDDIKSTLKFYMTNSSPSVEKKKTSNSSQFGDDYDMPF